MFQIYKAGTAISFHKLKTIFGRWTSYTNDTLQPEWSSSFSFCLCLLVCFSLCPGSYLPWILCLAALLALLIPITTVDYPITHWHKKTYSGWNIVCH